MAGLGIPVKLLHEGIGHTVTCELKTGEMYRGHLMNCEDNMNAMLEGVTVTGRDGKVTNLEQADGRGRGGLCQVNPCRYIIINTGVEPVQV